MGQQQLFLLVLVALIVGLTTLAGIRAFDKSQRQSVIDRMTETSIKIAADVQIYARRSGMYRSGNTTGDEDLVVDFGELSHYQTNDASGDGDYVDAVATYSLNGHSTLPSGYEPDACPDNSPDNTVQAYSREQDVSVCVSITGTSADDLKAGVAK